MSNRFPVAYIPHGGGPFSYVEMGADPTEVEDLANYWRALPAIIQHSPRALLVVSAHWEAPIPTVLTGIAPPLLYDYFGFPPAAYEITWPAPGAPQVAARVRDLLREAQFAVGLEPNRGFDHGVFIPLGRSFPHANIPTLQLSLKAGLDPQEHIAIGRALATLRNEGVLILGSGMSYHNMRGFGDPKLNEDAEQFDAWLQQTVHLPQPERDQCLIDWKKAPSARRVHPREEHLLPLMVVAGAAGEDSASVPFNQKVFNKRVSAIHFG